MDEQADWLLRRLKEPAATPQIDAFRASHTEAPIFIEPGKLPRLIGEEAKKLRRARLPVGDEPDVGPSAAERAYLEARMPTWKGHG